MLFLKNYLKYAIGSIWLIAAICSEKRNIIVVPTKGFTTYKRYISEDGMDSRNPFGVPPKKQKNSILLSWPRSGTNYFLAVYAKIFPDDIVFDEIFREGGDNHSKLSSLLRKDKTTILELVEKTPASLWQMVQESAAEEGGKAIAKVFYYHSSENRELWDQFKKENRIIHLIRKNPLDIFLSYKIAQQTGIWKIVSPGKNVKNEKKAIEAKSFHVSPMEVDSFLKRRKHHMERCRSFFHDADFQEIFYEDISVSTKSCVKVISDLFSCIAPKAQIEIDIRKQRTCDPRELVINYKEIEHFDKVEV